MTVVELINLTLDNLRRTFDYYSDERDGLRRFARDHQALLKAISRIGFECERNGWQFTTEECYKAVTDVVIDIRCRQADIKYLPVYLHSAIGRHLGQKAEEYAERQKARGPRKLATVTAATVDGIQVVTAVREKSTTETLSDLYRDLRRGRKSKAAAIVKQPALF